MEILTSKTRFNKIIKFFIVFISVLGMFAIAFYWMTHKPRAQRRPVESTSFLVEVIKLKRQNHHITVKSLGNVIAAQSIELISRVSGEIVYINPNFIPGGRFKTDELILRINPVDYQLDIKQKQSALITAEYDVKLEMGQQNIAQQEYKLLGNKIRNENQELVLRQPHLKKVKANLESAEASLKRANLDLNRTQIRSPFNSIVQTKKAGLGSLVSSGTQIATLVDTEKYWIQISIPVNQLKWINIPEKINEQGLQVKIYDEALWGPGIFRIGIIKSLMAGVETDGRMAQLLIEINDPLSLEETNREQPKLILGSYVRVEIEGKELTDVVCIPYEAIHDDQVWIMNPDKSLDIRNINIVWNDDQIVCTKDNNFHDNEQLIISNLETPVKGMKLRLPSTQSTTQNNKKGQQ